MTAAPARCLYSRGVELAENIERLKRLFESCVPPVSSNPEVALAVCMEINRLTGLVDPKPGEDRSVPAADDGTIYGSEPPADQEQPPPPPPPPPKKSE